MNSFEHAISLDKGSDSRLAVVPNSEDRVAICDFKDDILTWSYLIHKVGVTTFPWIDILASNRSLGVCSRVALF